MTGPAGPIDESAAREPDGAGHFDRMWAELAPIGLDRRGGYRRLAWSAADLECREWFRAEAIDLGLTLDEDANGNQWAWWGEPGPGAVVTGSHLDSVPGGGAFDGPLGVVSAFAALGVLRSRGVRPSRPVAVVNFSDEEGGRFGLACLGSRLMTGDVAPGVAMGRTDPDGVTLAEARAAVGMDVPPGADPVRLGRIGTFVELHVEQGRHLDRIGVPVGVASAVWPHGRWRIDFAGEGNHAGTTAMADRHDPVVTLAETVLAARRVAGDAGALATVGRVEVVPGATNAIASGATAWLDARGPRAPEVRAMVRDIGGAATEAGRRDGVEVTVAEESWSGGAGFGGELRRRLAGVVEKCLGVCAELPTGAGHDAAVLAGTVASAMLFVRNPTGVSHDPAEFAERSDCLAGVAALTAVVEDLCS